MTVAGLISVLAVGISVGALGRLLSRQPRPSTGWAIASGVVAAVLGTVVARLAGVDVSGLAAAHVLIQVAVAAGAVFLLAGKAGSPSVSGHRAERPTGRHTPAADGGTGHDARGGTPR